MKIRLNERLRMAIARDVEEIDEDDKRSKAKKEPELAREEHEHFDKCAACGGTGLDGDLLCPRCAGSGQALPSA